MCDSFYASTVNNTITVIRCTPALPLLFSLLCNELRKPVSKSRKTLELGRPVFFCHQRRAVVGPREAGGKSLIHLGRSESGVNPCENNAEGWIMMIVETTRGIVRISRNGRAVSGCIAHPSRDP